MTAAVEPGASPAEGGSLLDLLLREGHRFDFFQAVRLLELLVPEATPPGEGDARPHERIRFRPHTGLAFPPTDVHELAWRPVPYPHAEVTVTFMGLYGVDSPLPVYFYKSLANETEENRPLREFLDIFNHRLYTYFYRAWKKYRPALHPPQGGASPHTRIFRALAGLGTPGIRLPPGADADRLLALAGQLAGHVRNAVGLEHLVSDLLGGVATRVLENVPRRVVVTERPRVGGKQDRAARLGRTALVGQKVTDLTGKFRLALGPLGIEQYRALLPGGAAAAQLDGLVRLYAPDYLAFDVELRLRTADVPPARLSGGQRLGLDTWLGPPKGDVIAQIVSYERN